MICVMRARVTWPRRARSAYVANRSVVHKSLEPDGERQQPSVSGQLPNGWFADAKVDCVCDVPVPAHTCTSAWNRMEIWRAVPS